ncbi:FadR/GntR family transcriptional regulator [Actinomadura sp. SCN-SB]|uniref:FadR/GntR family transcriptional regulator n=1 Tax=Actinomadura sp. SCN-SB TaxID=3373092 RepID=UPI0037513DEB
MSTHSRIRVPKAGELVAGQLRRQIILGELEAGQALPPETALMDHYGVSRPTLREAFRVLEAEGLISIQRGARGGARVHLPDPSVSARYAGVLLQYRGATLADVYEARTILESRAAGLLAARRTRSEVDALDAALQESRRAAAEDPYRFVGVDERFHLLVVELGGNETLALLVEMLYYIVAAANISVTEHDTSDEQAFASVRRAHRMHERLVALIRDGDAEGAEFLWRRHLEGIAKLLTEELGARTVLDLLS